MTKQKETLENPAVISVPESTTIKLTTDEAKMLSWLNKGRRKEYDRIDLGGFMIDEDSITTCDGFRLMSIMRPAELLKDYVGFTVEIDGLRSSSCIVAVSVINKTTLAFEETIVNAGVPDRIMSVNAKYLKEAIAFAEASGTINKMVHIGFSSEAKSKKFPPIFIWGESGWAGPAMALVMPINFDGKQVESGLGFWVPRGKLVEASLKEAEKKVSEKQEDETEDAK